MAKIFNIGIIGFITQIVHLDFLNGYVLCSSHFVVKFDKDVQLGLKVLEDK